MSSNINNNCSNNAPKTDARKLKWQTPQQQIDCLFLFFVYSLRMGYVDYAVFIKLQLAMQVKKNIKFHPESEY